MTDGAGGSTDAVSGGSGKPVVERETIERRLHGHDPLAGHDTGGLPWEGREVTAAAFADDDGSADPDLVAALLARDEERFMALLGDGARLLVPIVATPVAMTEGAGGHASDAESSMSAVTLTAPDGSRAMPVFTGIAAQAAWDRSARPVPLTAAEVAVGALEQECSAVVIDLGSPSQEVLRLSQLWALSARRPWRPAQSDPQVRAALGAAVATDPALVAVDAEAGERRGQLVLTATLTPGLAADQVQASLAGLADALADPDIRSRIDEVTIHLRRA